MNKENETNSELQSLSTSAQITNLLKANPNLTSGLVTGLFTSSLLSPVDKALYLSMINHRSVLSKENFAHPFQGITQAMIARMVSGGLYYVFQGQMREFLYPWLRNRGASDQGAQFAVGFVAGTLAGVFTAPLTTIKYHAWTGGQRSFLQTVWHMKNHGGIRPFMNGMQAVTLRDMVFGSTYEFTRSLMHASAMDESRVMDFACNSSAAGMATLFSSPLNFVKNIQYSTPSDQASPSVSNVLSHLAKEVKANSSSVFGRASFFQGRMVLGWGTVRVAISMALGQQVFDESKRWLAGIR